MKLDRDRTDLMSSQIDDLNEESSERPDETKERPEEPSERLKISDRPVDIRQDRNATDNVIELVTLETDSLEDDIQIIE